MGTPVVEFGFRVQLLWSAAPGGRPWSTKFDYKGDDAQADAVSLLDAFSTELETWWAAAPVGFTNAFHDETVLETIRVYALTDPLTGVEAPPNLPLAGTGASVMPAEVAVVSSLRTATLGRAYRGRQYWGGLAQQAFDGVNGVFTTTLRAELPNLVNTLNVITDANLVNYQHSVMRRTGPGVNRYPAQAEPVTNVIVDQFADTQRRRGAR